MGRVERFEDLVAWQKARELAKLIYGISGEGAFARDFGLRDQIRRASVSVMSNIAEGFDRASRAEFHRFLVIAKGSCAEGSAEDDLTANVTAHVFTLPAPVPADSPAGAATKGDDDE